MLRLVVFFFLEQKPNKNNLLREELDRFWQLETIGKSEENVIYYFENEIQLKDTHRQKAPSNKTPALTKSTNMDI